MWPRKQACPQRAEASNCNRAQIKALPAEGALAVGFEKIGENAILKGRPLRAQ